MPLFGRRREKPSPRVMTAAGHVVDLRDRESVATLAMTRMSWQAVAWNYRNSIGELGQALRMKANLLSKLGWTAAYQPPGEDEPILLTGDPEDDKDEDGHPYVPEHVAKAAIECIQQLPWGDGYGFTGRIATGFDVPGEVWLHGFPDPETGDEAWKVRSSSEVTPSGGGSLLVTTVPGKPPRELDPDEETLIRLWVPHPEWGELSDSPLRTLLDVCEDVVLAGREIRAAAMSRIASNGILFVPEGLALVRPDQEIVRPGENGFASAFTAAMIAPINNEGHASAVAPLVIYGDPEDGQYIKHTPLDRRTDQEVIERQKACLDRLADGIDLPREAMRGSIGEANHWSAWLIDSQTFENHLEPGARMIADSVTQSYFRRRLTMPVSDGGWGLTTDEVALVRVWFDASTITRNTNRSSDADEAMDRAAISYKAYRKAKGFDEGDAPTEEDLQQIQMIKASRLDPTVMNQLAAKLLGMEAEVPGLDKVPALPPGGLQPAQGQPPVITNAPVAPGQSGQAGPPKAPAGARTAAGGTHPQGVLDSVRIIDAQALADIDRQLIEAIRHAAEAELAAVLRKAGNKIKAASQGKPELAAMVNGADPAAVGAMVGYDRLVELGLTEDVLLAAAFVYLQSKFASWSAAAIKDAVVAVSAMLAFPLVTTQALASTMKERIPAAWKRLESSLRSRAMSALYGRKGDTLPQGEVPDTIILPGDIREALAEIGGPSPAGVPGGLALGGDILREVDQRAVSLGFTWRYGVTPRHSTFHPHYEIAGERFESYTDPRLTPPPKYAWLGPHMHPGDHRGCFVGETEISGPRPVRGFERPYAGQGIKIRTDAGHQLTGTPNHPVLTPRGWVPLGELQEGDQLVVATGHQGALAVDQEYQQVPARIDDVATTLPMAERVLTAPVPSAAEDFHGDGTPGEITVVRSDGRLLLELEAAGVQLASDDVLQFAGCSPTVLAPEGVPDALVVADSAATGSGMGVGEPGTPLVERSARPAESLGGTLPTSFDAESIQPVEDGPAVDPVPGSKSLGAFAGQVALAEVVAVEVVELRGHVYNLSTLTGWYVANGVIVSNCMCDAVPAWAVGEADLAAAEVVDQESPAMHNERILAELDDAAGRVGTHSQRTRDERNRMVEVQTAWIERRAPR